MVNFVPNIIALDYLGSVNKITPEVASKAKSHLESGYQRELSYKHDDGSYSAFGKSDYSGSTWLTAFVAKSFNQASKYIQIEKKIVDEAFKFLRRIQASDGQFPEVGYMLSKSMQGGGRNTLTAYTLITFLESENRAKYEGTINKALSFIESTLNDINDTYSMAITAYALQLANHPQKDVFLNKLNDKAEREEGMRYWKRSDEAPSLPYTKNSINIETTAYALLAFTEANREIEAAEIMKWLVSQRSENGGFYSTQDTIVGLQALAKLSSRIHTSYNDIRVAVSVPSSSSVSFVVNQENSLVFQKQELPSNARKFEISASGYGTSTLQISYKYNLPVANKARFTLKPTLE